MSYFDQGIVFLMAQNLQELGIQIPFIMNIMKAKNIFGIIALLLSILTLLLVLTNFNPPAALAQNASSNLTAFQQATPTPQVEDASEIGSTDGILIMGVVIVLIVTLPLIFQKRK